MSPLVAAGVVGLGVSLARREKTRDPSMPGAEAIAIAGGLTAGLVGLLATALAVAGVFSAPLVGGACVALATLCWPWAQHHRTKTATLSNRSAWVVPLVVVMGGLALRLPPNDYPLAGRDQGTYSLRAHQLARTGALDETDRVLAAAGDTRDRGPAWRGPRPGPSDISGLYSKVRQPGREDRYEAAYRPGWYLADRERGRVVPQFLHLHPSLLAVGVLATGSVMPVVFVEAALALLAIFCVGRRLWNSWVWAGLAATLVALHPLAIWVGRTALSEGPTLVLIGASLVCILRAAENQDEDGPPDLARAAAMLGMVAWVRGNGWLWLPVIAPLLWLAPTQAPRRRLPALVFLGVALSGVLVHAFTSFPYVYDELHRMIPWTGPVTPQRLAVGAIVVAIAWISIDELAFGPHGRPKLTAIALRLGPPTLVVMGGLAIVAYWFLRPDELSRPFSRLDPVGPLLGGPLLLCAGGGAVLVAARTRLRGAAGLWGLALGAIVVVTLGLYARRNLPQVGLYYYGRYLTAELLPAACLLAAHAIQRLHRLVRGASKWRSRRGLISAALSGCLAGGLLWTTAGVLLLHPVTRMQEFAGAEQLLDALAERTDPDAVIVAGGEGWHSGHTFNQVGGALHARYGRTVVPFRTSEAAYATLHELLIGHPSETGSALGPVYLLVNEATHHMRRPSDGRLVAAFDDRIWPPFVATEVTFAEMFVDRLTPVNDSIPTEVTRDELRMVLIRVDLDPQGRGQHVFDLRHGSPHLSAKGGAGIVDGVRCLSRETPLVLKLEGLPPGPGGLVLVAAPGNERHNSRWTVRVDGTRRGLDPPRSAARERDTLGPLVMRAAPSTIEILGSPKAGHHICRHGALAEVRWLEAPPSVLDQAPVQAMTFGPPRDLGHPVKPTSWVAGRGLGRYRSGVKGGNDMVGMAMRLRPDHPLRFSNELLPSSRGQLDVVVTLTGTQLEAGAELVVLADKKEVGRATPPSRRARSWQSPPMAWSPPGSVARFTVRLDGAGPDDWVLVRDIGLFSRAPSIASSVAADSRR